MTQEQRIQFEEMARTELAEFEGPRTTKQNMQDICEFFFTNIGEPIRFVDALYVASKVNGIVNFLESIDKD